MRNISCALTKAQIRNGSKTVTRRLGWEILLKPSAEPTQLMACEKCMGRKAGEPLIRIRPIEVVTARREPLQAMIDDPVYGKQECMAEGFPDWTPEQFVQFFCSTHKLKNGQPCMPETKITRIEFKYL
jgi:hypothetical protein